MQPEPNHSSLSDDLAKHHHPHANMSHNLHRRGRNDVVQADGVPSEELAVAANIPAWIFRLLNSKVSTKYSRTARPMARQ